MVSTDSSESILVTKHKVYNVSIMYTDLIILGQNARWKTVARGCIFKLQLKCPGVRVYIIWLLEIHNTYRKLSAIFYFTEFCIYWFVFSFRSGDFFKDFTFWVRIRTVGFYRVHTFVLIHELLWITVSFKVSTDAPHLFIFCCDPCG